MHSTTFIRLYSSLFHSVHLHASLPCLVLFICSVVFAISRSVDCMRGTDTREGRRGGIRGEGMEDRGREHDARHMAFQKFLTTKPLIRNHPFVAPKCSKTHLQQSKIKKISGGNTHRPPLQGRGGGKKEGGESE